MERPVENAKPNDAETAGTRMRAFLSMLRISPSTAFSILALVMSGGSLYLSYYAGVDSAHIEALKTEHGLFTDLAKTQYDHPAMSHLFAFTSEQYTITTRQVAALSQALPAPDKLKYQLEEQGIAHYIFTLLEETYFYWVHAKEVGDWTRAKLLDGDMDYFSQQMCNPRLAWYWDTAKGMRMAYSFSNELRRYVEQQMKDRACNVEDATGPFG